MKNSINKKGYLRIISFLFLFLFVFFIVCCHKNSSDTNYINQTKTHLKMSSEDSLILNDANFKTYINLSYKLMKAVVQSNIDTSTLRKLLINQDLDSLAYLSSLNNDTVKNWTSSVMSCLGNLQKRYNLTVPDTLIDTCHCAMNDKISKGLILISKFRAKTSLDSVTNIILYNTYNQGNGCYWTQYSACLVVCVAAGPILYWLCAFCCYCWDCYGPTRDKLCGGTTGGGGGSW